MGLRKLFRRDKGSKSSTESSSKSIFHSTPHVPSITAPVISNAAASISKATQKVEVANETGRGTSEMVIKLGKDLWPSFEPGLHRGDLAYDGPLLWSVMSGISRWARHDLQSGGQLGEPVFQPRRDESVQVAGFPRYLYDTTKGSVVPTTETGPVNYLFISHVWGETQTLDGQLYGVTWPVQVRDSAKLDMIFEASRSILGERYIWMDVLCINPQFPKHETVSQMDSYLLHASGCLVWLDNAYGNAAWNDVLAAFRAVNQRCHMDQHGALASSLKDLEAWTVEGHEILDLIEELLKLERAPWFKRVWTLQETVLSDDIFFCTPERFITNGKHLFKLIEMADEVCRQLLAQGVEGAIDINFALQESELFKIMQLRYLYQQKSLGLWHVSQALRTRQCRIEIDRFVGALGMLSVGVTAGDLSKTPETLYRDLFVQSIEHGDLSPLMYFGRTALSPSYSIDMSPLPPRLPFTSQVHTSKFLATLPPSLSLQNIALQEILFCLPLQACAAPHLLNWKNSVPPLVSYPDARVQLGVARAFGISAELASSGLIPCIMAIMAAVHSLSEDFILDRLKDKLPAADLQSLKEKFYEVTPTVRLVFFSLIHLVQENDWVLCTFWDAVNQSYLAMLSESLEGVSLGTDEVLLVTAGTEADMPQGSALVTRKNADGAGYRKIGVAVARGQGLRGGRRGNLVLRD